MTEARGRAITIRLALPKVPAHVAVLLGLSAGTYSVFLAGATALEASTETAAAADRAPIAGQLAGLVAGHDQLSSSLDLARARYGDATAAYDQLAQALAAYEARIQELAAHVESVQQAAASLPGSVATPRPIAVPAPITTVRQVSAITPVAPKPVTTTTTGASGVKP